MSWAARSMARASGLSAETLRSSATRFPVVGSNESADSLPADANIRLWGSQAIGRRPAPNFTPPKRSARLAVGSLEDKGMKAAARTLLASPRHPLLRRFPEAWRRGELTADGCCAGEGQPLGE